MRKTLLFGLTLATLVAGFGCGDKGGSGTENTSQPTSTTTGGTASTDKKSYKITMIAKSSDNPVFAASHTGADAAAKELSEKLGVEITIDWRTPPKEDGQEQANRIAQAVNDGTDAILLSCSDAAKVTAAINDAVDKGIPVMTFDSDAPDSKRFAFYGADNHDCGVQTMAELAKLNGGKGNVAILAGNQNAPNLQERVKGAQEEAKKYPGIKIVGVFNHVETPQDATAAVMSAMQANPQIDGWAMIGGWPLFAPSLLKDLDPAKVKIVAVDCLPAQMAYIDKGIAPVLLAQPVFNWGYESVKMIVEKVVEKKEVSGVHKMELVPVTKNNLNDWGKQLKDWGFTDVDPKYLK